MRISNLSTADLDEITVTAVACVTGAIIMGDQVLRRAVPRALMDLVVGPRTRAVVPNPQNPNVPGFVV